MERTIGERLATVEANLENEIEQAEKREKIQAEILATVQSLQQDMARVKSFFGGCVFVVSCLTAFFYKFGGSMWALVTKLKTGN